VILMGLHLFIDISQELVVQIIRGDDKDAKRFKEHPNQEHKLTHIRISGGEVKVME
jgi:hypothetical protein